MLWVAFVLTVAGISAHRHLLPKIPPWDHAHHPAPPAPSCPAGFACYAGGRSFAKALNAPAGSGAKLALICTAAERCAISGVQLRVPPHVEVRMAYVDIEHQQPGLLNGGLMNIGGRVGGGSVVGTRLTFSGGKAKYAGGAVVISEQGSFTCTDCAFRDNSARRGGGAVDNAGGSLRLIRPSFSGNQAGLGAAWGPDCYCAASKLCVGCTCHRKGADASYCP